MADVRKIHSRRQVGKSLGIRPAFSLVELLVVISIIALLAGMLYPSLTKAKALGRSAGCKANLHALGVAMRMYLNDSNDVMPVAAAQPSLHLSTDPRIADVLGPHLSNSDVLRCPADTETNFFASEGSSYMYNTLLGGQQVGRDFLTLHIGEIHSPVLYDYESFHGEEGKPGATNYLFADLHVGDLVD